MTRFKYLFISILICTLLQTTLIEHVAVFGVKPLLLVGVSVCAVLNFGLIPGTVCGLICGLIMDITSGRGVGLSALLLMYICIGCGLLCPRIFKDKIGVVILFTFISAFLYEFLYSFFLIFVWGKASLSFILIKKLLPETIYTAVFAIPIFFIFKRVKSTEWTNS